MTGRVLATARWRRLAGEGHDTCRLVAEPGGFMLVGHARFVEAGRDVALDYVVRCDDAWHSTSADVTGTVGDAAVGWRIGRNGGWSVNGASVADSGGCHDIDLGFTPATNLLPLRRLAGTLAQGCAVAALWLPWPEGRGQVLAQTYRANGGGTAHYAAPGFAADLTVHPSGFVTHYPGGWEGTVDAP